MKQNRLDTRIHLVAELEKLPFKSHPLIQTIIEEAEAGEYHDYKNEKYVCGKLAVSGKLRQAAAIFQSEELLQLAIRVESGDFDEEADAEDQKELAQMIRGMSRGQNLH